LNPIRVYELVREEDSLDASRPTQNDLSRRRDRDAPRAGLELSIEQLWSKGRLAVGREIHTVRGAVGRHRRDIVLQLHALEDHHGRAEGPVEERMRFPNEVAQAPPEYVEREALQSAVHNVVAGSTIPLTPRRRSSTFLTIRIHHVG
jgi:hypothetical protein